MTYRDQSFEDRWRGQWAAEAETAYKLDRFARQITVKPHGLERTPFSAEALMAAPDHIRYAPDFMEEVNGALRLVEVKGCGRDQTIKLKQEQLSALVIVAKEDLPVWLFCWNNQTRTVMDVPFGDVEAACVHADTDVFDSQTTRPKRYYKLPWGLLAALGGERKVGA